MSKIVAIGVRKIFSVALAAAVAAQLTAVPVRAADNLSLSNINAFQFRNDDCGLNACGYISPDVAKKMYSLMDLSRMDGTGAQLPQLTARLRARAAAASQSFDQFVQTVYLDFETRSPTATVTDEAGNVLLEFPAHVYSQQERDTIQLRLEADYKRFPTIRFTQRKPADGRVFSTLTFSCERGNPAGSCLTLSAQGLSILFGRADGIDFLNANTGDNVFVQSDLVEFLIATGNFDGIRNVLGIPIDENDPASVAEAISTAVVNQASNVAAHELGHVLGLRHHDSFGAPGDGIPTNGTPARNAFVPAFDRAQNATETNMHLMASGESTNQALTDLFTLDAYFGEREAIKLLATRFALRQQESGVNRRFNSGREVAFTRFLVPNTLVQGENAGSRFLDVRGALITEARVTPQAPDTYRFKAKAGELISTEVVSFSNAAATDPVITNLSLYAINADGSRTLVALNAQSFEGFDPLLLDVPLPRTGEYELEVVAAKQIVIGPMVIPLDGPNATLTAGNYELLTYMVNGPLTLKR